MKKAGTSIWSKIIAFIGLVASLITIYGFLSGNFTILEIYKSGSDKNTDTTSPAPIAKYTPSLKPSTLSPSPVITNSPVPQISVKTGSTITFGKYKGEEINWYVADIDRSAGTVLLVSVKAVDVVMYHDNHNSKEIPTWTECDLRYWLNNTFYQVAFSQSEKNYILTSVVQTSNADICKDKVYILSYQETENYLQQIGGSWMLTECFELCKTKNTTTGTPIYNYNKSKNPSGGYSYWLRTPTTASKMHVIGSKGDPRIEKMPTNYPYTDDNGVRPVILVSLNLFR